MNTIYKNLITSELDDAALYSRACQSTYRDIQIRVRKQQKVVEKCSERLGQLIDERAWEKAETPEAAREARHECSEAAENYQDEHRLLMAMETAALNAKEDTARAGRKVYGVIGGIVTSEIGGNDIQALIEERGAIDSVVAV